MVQPLTVDNVRLTEILKDQITAAMQRSGAKFYTIAVTVTNNSASTQFVTSTIEQIRYEPERRTLHLAFTRPDTGAGIGYRRQPGQVAIEPGARTVIEHDLDFPITCFDDAPADPQSWPESWGQSREVRIDTDVDAIECRLAYSDEAFPWAEDLTAPVDDALTHAATRHLLAKWQAPDNTGALE